MNAFRTIYPGFFIISILTFLSGCREEKIQLPPIVPDYGGQAVLYPGTVVARDLSTPDLRQSILFYRGLLGWDFRPVPNVDAAIAEQDGRTIALFFEKNPAKGSPLTPGLWIPAFSVEDLDPAVARFRAKGGAVLTGRLKMPDRGEMVVLRDPEGAVFSALVSSTGDPVPGSPNPPWVGEVLVTEEFKNATKIYEATLGISVRGVEPLNQGGRVGELFAGTHRIGRIASSFFANIPAAWLPVLGVEDLAATSEQVESLGGMVLLRSGEAAALPTILIQDPTGALLVLQQSTPVSQ